MPRVTRGGKHASSARKITSPQHHSEAKILVGAGPRGESFARAAYRKGTEIEHLRSFLNVLQTHYGHILVYCDQEECLRDVVHGTARRLGTGVTGAEQSLTKDVRSASAARTTPHF